MLGSSGEGRQGQVSEALRGVWIFSPVESRTSAELQKKNGWPGKSGSPGREDLLEEELATHSSPLAWEISWTVETGGLQSIGSQRVGYD